MAISLGRLTQHFQTIPGSSYSSSTAQGGGGSFKNRKPIGEIGCCESRMAERIHSWTERWLVCRLIHPSIHPRILLFCLLIYVSVNLSISLSFHPCLCSRPSIILFLSMRPSVYLSLYFSLSRSVHFLVSLSVCRLAVYLSSCLSICPSSYPFYLSTGAFHPSISSSSFHLDSLTASKQVTFAQTRHRANRPLVSVVVYNAKLKNVRHRSSKIPWVHTTRPFSPSFHPVKKHRRASNPNFHKLSIYLSI